MDKRDFFIGVLLGLFTSLLGSLLYTVLFIKIPLKNAFLYLQHFELIGKVITIGSVLSLVLFLFLMNKKKDMMARGIIMSVIILAIATILL